MLRYTVPEKEEKARFDSKFCDNVQIPSLPLRGPKPFPEIIHMIHKAVEDEANTADFYRHLLKEAPNKLHCEFIKHIYDQELEHLQIFTKLYCYYTENEPKYCINPVCISCYKEGLLQALIGELNTVEFYRNVQLSTMDKVIIDTFYMVMVDEQSHATMLSTLYGTCK